MANGKPSDRASEAYRRLRDLIQAGDLSAGERLTEAKAAELVGTGRGPVRESLLRLQAEGFVEHLGSGRSRVVAYTEDEDPAELLYRYELREQIAVGAVRLASKNMTGWQIDRVRELARDVEEAWHAQDREVRFEANGRFHLFLVTHCGNPLLLRVWHTYRLAPSRPRSPELEARIMAAVPEAERERWPLTDVVDAIAAHDPDRAEAVMRHRVQQITQALRDVVWRQDAE